MKSALVIGALGQDGTYLCEHLLSLGYRVFGLVRTNAEIREHAGFLVGKVHFLYGDVRDELSIRSAVQKSWPDEIYNLAGQVFVPVSWQSPAETFDVNVGGLARLLKVVDEVKRDARVYQASTSEMFGNHDGACTELTPMNPASPYGVSKLAAHRLVGIYRRKGLYVVGGILFNHESPRRGMEMVTRKIAMAVAGWAAGGMEELRLGLLQSRRDWGFAGDYVKAMHLMLQQTEPVDYVAGTGETHSVQEFLEAACDAADIMVAQANIVLDSRLVRDLEIHSMRADNSKIAALGWGPRTTFRELVAMMVNAETAKRSPLRQGVTA